MFMTPWLTHRRLVVDEDDGVHKVWRRVVLCLLHCTVLCCIVLYCIVLCCTVLYCAVSMTDPQSTCRRRGWRCPQGVTRRVVLCLLHCTVLCCIVLYCVVLCRVHVWPIVDLSSTRMMVSTRCDGVLSRMLCTDRSSTDQASLWKMTTTVQAGKVTGYRTSLQLKRNSRAGPWTVGFEKWTLLIWHDEQWALKSERS